MVAARPYARPHALVALTVASALLFGACGGKSHSKSTPSTNAPTTDTASAVSPGTTAVKAKCVTVPGKQTARIRFVNLYTNPEYPESAVDVWQGLGPDDPCAKKLTTVPFGQAGEYTDVTASDASGHWSAVAYVAGSNDKEHEIVVQGETLLGGEQATMVFEGTAPQAGAAASAGSAQTFLEKNNVGDPAMLVPAKGKVSLGITSALQTVVDNGVWVVGSPKSGCIRALSDTGATRVHVAGTAIIRYSVDAGEPVAFYPAIPGTCTGAPVIGPVTVNGAAGSSAFVIAYGADAKNLKLLVLPIA